MQEKRAPAVVSSLVRPGKRCRPVRAVNEFIACVRPCARASRARALLKSKQSRWLIERAGQRNTASLETLANNENTGNVLLNVPVVKITSCKYLPKLLTTILALCGSGEFPQCPSTRPGRTAHPAGPRPSSIRLVLRPNVVCHLLGIGKTQLYEMLQDGRARRAATLGPSG